MRIAILYYQFLDDNGMLLRIGGVETYIYNLAKLFIATGYEVTVCQGSAIKFRRSIDGINIIGVGGVSAGRKQVKRTLLLSEAAAILSLDMRNDLIVFAADQCSANSGFKRTIGIQHGVSWDLPVKYLTSRKLFKTNGFGAIYKAYLKFRALRSFERSRYKVCVDYNFVNWYKAVLTRELDYEDIYVIPNFADRSNEEWAGNSHTGKVSIIFARRYYDYRGTRIAATALERISREFPSVVITFAGEGPDEAYLVDVFRNNSAVQFMRYAPTDASKVLAAYTISVVPSLACEGTSYSVLEAMASGCAVVATAVGGVTNILCDEFNGLLVDPTANSLYEGVKRLIIDSDLRLRLTHNARETVSTAFSRNKWERSWLQVIDNIKVSE